MTFGSCFAGVGGIDLGLERAGMELRWQIEIEDFPTRVLEKHWPDVARFRDVRDCGAHNLERVDLIAGGFPCQDISVAGRGAGLHGAKSALWFELLRVVQELRPTWVLAENVPALRTRGIDVVLDGLGAAGYSAWPLVVGARHVGAPHRRDRVWIVAHTDSAGLRSQRRSGLLDGERSPSGHDANGCSGAELVGHTDGRGLREQPWRRCGTCGSGSPFPAGPGAHQHDWEEPRVVYAARELRERSGAARRGRHEPTDASAGPPQPPLGQSTAGLPGRLARRHRLKALGNSVVPSVVEAIGRAIMRVAA